MPRLNHRARTLSSQHWREGSKADCVDVNFNVRAYLSKETSGRLRPSHGPLTIHLEIGPCANMVRQIMVSEGAVVSGRGLTLIEPLFAVATLLRWRPISSYASRPAALNVQAPLAESGSACLLTTSAATARRPGCVAVRSVGGRIALPSSY